MTMVISNENADNYYKNNFQWIMKCIIVELLKKLLKTMYIKKFVSLEIKGVYWNSQPQFIKIYYQWIMNLFNSMNLKSWKSDKVIHKSIALQQLL